MLKCIQNHYKNCFLENISYFLSQKTARDGLGRKQQGMPGLTNNGTEAGLRLICSLPGAPNHYHHHNHHGHRPFGPSEMAKAPEGNMAN